MRHFVISSLFLGLLAGCSSSGLPLASRLPSPRDLPFIHKIDIQQGNVLTQDMVAQLRPQMDKKQVQFIMGTPIIQDTFNNKRWDYIYTYEYGGGKTERRHITLVFDDDKLDYIDGDVTPASAPLVATVHQDRSVRVPGFKKQSLLTRLKYKMPFVEPPKEVVIEDLPEDPNVAPVDAETIAKVDAQEEEAAEVFEFEAVEPSNPYADIQAGPGEGIVVPPDAPRAGKKKGIVTRFFDSIGIGAGAEGDAADDEDDKDYDPGDPRYRDITDQDDV